MKKTRKLSAFLTALCLTGTMLSALPVTAEDTAYATYSYAVIGTDNQKNPEKYVFADSSGDTWYTSADYFDMTLAVGDMITIKNAMLGVTCIEGTNDLSIDKLDGYSAEKTGSVLDNPKTAEFTVQEIQTGSPFGNRIYLEKDGIRYHIFTDWIEKNYAEYSYLDWDSVSVGDTVTCILYDDYPVIGLNSALPFDAQEFFVVKGTHHSEEETAIRMDYYYYYPDSSVNTKYPHRYVYYTGNFDSLNLSYGDILLADGGFTTVQEETTKAYELILDEGTTLTKAGNCSDFMESKKLTVTSASYDGHPLEPFFSIWTYHLTDTDGNSYYYSENLWGSLFDVEIGGYSEGDTVTFAVWQDSAIIPLSEAIPQKTEYAVIGTDNAEHPTKYILVNNKGETFLTGTDAFSETFTIGDVISIQDAEIISTSMAGTNSLGIEPQENYSVQKNGSILGTPQTAEFTVTSVPDVDSGINCAGLEKDGNLYQIFTDWIASGSAEYSYLDWDSVSVGDTVTCILYDNYPVIATELVSEIENPYNRFFIVTDAENHIAEYYYHIDDEILHTPADFRNVSEGWNIKFGDVLTV
ncbi:MAG: hypothetical protein IJ644_06780, partial [Oscillospiraceae bacterium]|nr:hypothetical protein [Oscillospiraceae bacterium]